MTPISDGLGRDFLFNTAAMGIFGSLAGPRLAPSPRASLVTVDGQTYLAVRGKSGMSVGEVARQTGLPEPEVARIVTASTPVEVTAAKSFTPDGYLRGMGAYKDVGGHHPLSGRAFGYGTYEEAMAIGRQEMLSNGWGHPQPLTTFQQRGYMAFGQTGEPLTITRMSQIEVDAMVKAGIPREYAEQAVSAAIWERFATDQFTPTHIPWVGPNPGVKP